jgi:outer membrane protein
VRVAQETLKARLTVAEQVNALAAAQLKSQVDVSFAQVNVAEARLLLIRSQDTVKQGYADLARALGEDRPVAYQVQEIAAQPALPPSVDALIAQGIQNRPELREQQLHLQAAERFEEAEKDLKLPNLTLVGVGGGLPYLDQTPRVTPHDYEGVALNLEVPLFNGHLFSARRQAAHYQAVVENQHLRDLRQQVEHDVRTAWLSASTAYERIPVSEELVKQAQMAMDLAQGRYNLGLSSIVELTQAQLNLTQAEMENVSAKYDFESTYANLQYTIGALR